MAGNFRGVLIFVIFVVDLAVTKFSHPRKLMPGGDMVLCEVMMMGVATNIVAARPTLSSIVSNSSHCHPADRCSTLIFFYLMLFVQVSVGIWLSNKEDRERVYRLHHRFCSSATPLDWLLSRNLKPRKLILRAFSDFPRKLDPTKIIRHAVYCHCY